jgi:sarcosine oxidase delta subunit
MGSGLAKDALRGFCPSCRSRSVEEFTVKSSWMFKREVEAPEENYSKFGGE